MINRKALSQLYYLNLEIRDLEEKILEVRSKSFGVSKLTGMPLSKNKSDPIFERIRLIESLQEILEHKKNQFLKEQIILEEFIGNIVDPETRMIFSKRYISLMKWNKIAKEMYMSERTAQRKHAIYLELLAKTN